MTKISIDLEGNAQDLANQISGVTDDMITLNKTTKDFNEESKKGFKEGADAADKYGKQLKDNETEEKKQIGLIEKTRIELEKLKKAQNTAGSTDELKKYNKQLEETQLELKKLETVGTDAFDNIGKEAQNQGGIISNALSIAGGLGIAFGVEAIISGIFEVGAAVVETIDKFRTLRGEVQTLTGLQGDALDVVIVKGESIAKTFDQDVSEVFKAANVLANEFNISQEEALGKLEAGLLGSAGATEEVIEQVKEYSSQINAAGGSADDLFNIVNKSAKDGVFSDKGIDVVKEFGLRIREQTQGTADALDKAFGKEFTDKIFKGINDGSLSSVDALKLVSQQMNDSTIPASELQTVIADVFGGPGEDAGLQYLQTLHEIDGSVEDLIDNTNVLTREQQASLEANKNLAEAQNELSKLFDDAAGSGGSFFTNLQAVGFEFLTEFLRPFIDLWGVLVDAFAPLSDAFDELGETLGLTGEGFSFIEIALFPLKLSFQVIGFLLSELIGYFTEVITNVSTFVKSSEFMTSAIDSIAKEFQKLKDAFLLAKDFLTSGFDEVATVGKQSARLIDKNFTQPMLKSIETLDKAGRERTKNEILRNNLEIKSKLDVLDANDTLTEGEGIALTEKLKANKRVLDELNSINNAEVKSEKEAEEEKNKIREAQREDDKKAQDKANSEAIKATQKRNDELIKMEEELQRKIEELYNKSEKAKLDSLEGEELFAKIKENELEEIDLLEKGIIEKGKALDSEFALTEGQIEQLEVLRRQSREKELTSIIDFNTAKKLAEVKANDDANELRKQFSLDAVDEVKRIDTDLSEVDFELFKEEEKLRIQQEYSQKRIELLDDEIEAKKALIESDGSVTLEEQNQLDSLALQQSRLQQSVDDMQASRDELANERGKFSMAEFLGLSDDEFDRVKDSLGAITDTVVSQLSDVFAAQQEAQEARIDLLSEEIDDKEDALDRELALNEQGFASNVEGKREELRALEEEKVKAQKKAEELAKRQFILDTAVQASSIITASANVLKGFSTIPLIGQILGLTQVGLMVAGFFASRAAAYQKIKASKVSLEKGGSGDNTGMFRGKRHNQGGERFLDHVEVEHEEKWAVFNRGASKKHGKLIDQFAEAINNDRLDDLLFGTGVYMKRDIDKKIVDRNITINKQQVIMSAGLTSDKMVEIMSSVDKNLEGFIDYDKSKKRIIPTEWGRIELENGKETRIRNSGGKNG